MTEKESIKALFERMLGIQTLEDLQALQKLLAESWFEDSFLYTENGNKRWEYGLLTDVLTATVKAKQTQSNS